MGAFSRPFRRLTLVRCVLAVVCVAVVAFFHYAPRAPLSAEAEARFVADLKKSDAGGEVTLDGRTYRVREGVVTATDGGSVSPSERQEAIRLAYALLLARKGTTLSLEGTDPELLHEAIGRLSAVRDRLAAIQPTPKERYLVRHSLYPVDFLYALENTERARQEFLASGKDSAWKAFSQAQRLALEEGAAGARRFSRAFSDIATLLPVAILPGKLTKASTEQSISSILQGFEEVRAALLSQEACLNGTLSECPAAGSDTYTIPLATPKEDDVAFEKTLGLFDAAFGGSPPTQRIVALESSGCLPGLPGKSYLLPLPNERSKLYSYMYMGDLLLQPLNTRDQGPVLSWFVEQGVSHLIFNPMTFYTCPDVAKDIARAKALLRIEDVLALAPKRKNAVIYETDTIRALLLASETADRPTASKLRTLYWAYRNGSSGLEDVVYDVALGLETVMTMHDKGIPTDTSANFLFSTHSGYFGLLLAHNRTARAGQPRAYEADENLSFLGRFERYSADADTISTESLIHDISTYLKAHK